MNTRPGGERVSLREARELVRAICGEAVDAEERGAWCCVVLALNIEPRPVIAYDSSWTGALYELAGWRREMESWSRPDAMYHPGRRLVDFTVNAEFRSSQAQHAEYVASRIKHVEQRAGAHRQGSRASDGSVQGTP